MVLTIPRASMAQTKEDKLTNARMHFTKGQELFKLKRYDEALKELMSAFVLDPNPSLVYNIARVHEERGDLVNALKFFKNFLTIAPKTRNKRAVKRKIKTLTKQIANMPRQGYLSVVSAPPGGSVRLDGQVIGLTPLNAANVPVGPHRVDIFLDRYEPHSTNVEITSTQTARLDVTLRDRPTSVLISTAPPGGMATLYAPDARQMGPCPCVAELSAGRYKLEVTLPGHQPKELVFVKKPLETLKLNVNLAPIETVGQLLVQSNVPGAEVRIDGTPLGRTPLAQPIPVRPGTVLVEVVAPGRPAWRGQALIAVGRLTRVQALLDPAGMLGHPGNRPVVPFPDTGGGSTSGQAIGGWVTLSAGLAAIVAGGVTMGISLYDQHQFENGTYLRLAPCTGGRQRQGCVYPPAGSEVLLRNDQTQAYWLDKEASAKTLMNASIGLYAGGGALLLTGIILLATDGGSSSDMPSLSEAPRFGLDPLPGGALMRFELPFE